MTKNKEPRMFDLEKLDHCNNSSDWKAYKSIVDHDANRAKKYRDLENWVGRFIGRPRSTKMLKVMRMPADLLFAKK